MSNEIEKRPDGQLQPSGNYSFTHNGSGMQVGYVGQQTNYINLGGFATAYIPPVLNTEYYNLFVADQRALDGYIAIPRKQALNDFTEQAIREIYAKPGLAAADDIKALPSLFVIRNHFGNHTDEGQIAGFGYVQDIQIKGDAVIVLATQLLPIQQERLNCLEQELRLLSAPENNELDCVHWAIKKVNLLQLIEEQKLLSVMYR